MDTTENTQTSDNTEEVDLAGSFDTESEKGASAESLDLDSVERFRFQGREWTPDELRKAYLMQADYTRKTQELAEQRKYQENYAVDAARVLQDPSRFEEFKQIYPKQYVDALKQTLESYNLRSEGGQRRESQGNGDIDQRLAKYDRFIAEYEKRNEEQEITSNEQFIESTINKFKDKYPYADENLLLARAETLVRQGHNLKDEKAWESLFKSTHTDIENRIKAGQKQLFNSQRQANSKAKDVASGGGIPGQAPKKMKLGDVKNQMIADLKRQAGA